MFALNERLSEYSYGFGATNEALGHLRSIGAQAVPFLPSLVHENELGFDVAFGEPGALLMLQFKLGHQLSRYVRRRGETVAPEVARPFWRFDVDVDQPQFLRLREWEARGADVYYVAPRFADWRSYQRHFLREAILDHSLLITPGDIETGSGGTPGKHRVVYDRLARFVCSEPRQTAERRARDELTRVASRREGPEPLKALLERANSAETARPLSRLPRSEEPARAALAERIRARARTEIEGEAAVFAAEAWAEGVQVMFVGQPASPQTLAAQ